MPIDIAEAVVQSLLTHFNTALPAANADFTRPGTSGWPEWSNGIEGVTAPFITCTPRRHIAEYHDVQVYRTEDDPEDPDNDASKLYTFRLGRVLLPVVLDLWSPHKYGLHQYGAVVESAFHNDIPFTTLLSLDVPDYYGAKVQVYDIEEVDRPETSSMTQLGERRLAWTLRCHLDILVQAKHRTLVAAEFAKQITIGGVTVTDDANSGAPINTSDPVIS